MMVGLTITVLLAAALPSLHLIKPLPEGIKNFSRSLSFLPTVTVDTDPENMLSPSEPVRIFHDEMKKRMDLHDMVVVGIVNEHDPNGVFNPYTGIKTNLLFFEKKGPTKNIWFYEQQFFSKVNYSIFHKMLLILV